MSALTIGITPQLRGMGFLVGILLLGTATVRAAGFDEQRAAVSSSVDSQSEEAITNLLKAGIAENRPAPAVALAAEWLRRNLPKNPTLLFQAGRAAELSGELKDAVAFYQQALKLADPKSDEAGEAITAVHALLIHALDNPGGAYSFGLNEAKSLAVNPRFRQFDRWFLDMAMASRDGEAVANRLLATMKAGVTDDQLIALYSGDFRWLLNAVDGYVEQPQSVPLTQELYEAIKDLTEAIHFDDELKLRLDWAVSVKAYNLAQIGGGGAPKAVRRGGKDKKKGPKVEVDPGSPVEKLAPPIAEATALLARYPQHARWVQDGWAGGGNGQHYRSDPKLYWPHEIDAKMAPVVAALPKLSPDELADVMASWGDRYYADNAVRPMEVRAVRDYVSATPALWDSRHGVLILPCPWNELAQEAAQALDEKTSRLADPRASHVRAIAAGGKDFDKAMAALLGPEAWRLGPNELNGTYADQLWHYCGRPGGNAKRDEWINKSKALAATLAAADAKKEDPADKRIAAFRNLWADYKSPQPKIPAVRSRLATVLKFTPEVVPELLKDPTPEAQSLVLDAIAAGMEDAKGPLGRDARANSVSTGVYNPWFYRIAQATYGGLNWLKNDKERYKPHPLEPVLRAAVSERLAQGKIEPWLTMAWINLQFPENNDESVKLMQALFNSPAWAGLPLHVQYGAREWFKKNAMTPGQAAWVDAADPALACADLTALPATADAPAAIAALTKAIEAARKSPVFFEIQGIESLAAIPDEAFANENLQLLFVDLIDNKLTLTPAAKFSERVFNTLAKRNNPAELLRTSGYLWKNVALYHRTYPAMLKLAESLVDTQPSAASTLALGGLATIDRHKQGHTWFKRETDVPLLKSIRGKAAMKLGLIVIPVAVTHPAYPVYQSQAEWMSGNEDSAWNQLDANWEPFIQTHRELSVPYLMWVLQRSIYGRDEARQETLVKSLIGWAGEAGSPLTITEKAMVEIAYGDIALQRGQVREAHEIFTRTQKNEAYAGLAVRHEAALRRVRAERIAKNFDAALQTLADLELERVPEIWTDTRFARAEVHFDMEEFNDAKDDIDSILARDPNHADSRILLGKVQLKRQKLMEATEVELGSASGQTSLMPGESLKVTLSDPTLAVSGAGTEIEVVVWANSGDKETFFLRQFGDEKTKFRGEVPTVLGAPAAGDGKLQVIGDDEVFYAYSKRFLEKMDLTDEKRGGPITIASDAVLVASARKLLTDAEQRSADMRSLMDEIGLKGKGEHLEGAAKAQLAARALNEEKSAAAADPARFISQVAKPGNPVHVRVIDPDRSRTAEIDELTVSVSATSGDSISRVTLRETGTHSGWFEGSIPTTGAQAQAFAQNSEPGRAPNMVISPSKDYPAWRPVPTKGVIPDFTVDLNDNLPLGELTITAREPGAALRKFIVQTAMNPSDWTTVATFPTTKISLTDPGKPSVMVVNEEQGKSHYGARSVYEMDALRSHMATGWLAHQPDQAIAKNVTGISTALPESIATDIKWLRGGTHPNPAVVVRFQAYFHEKEDVTRRFALDLGNIPDLKIPADAKQKSEPAEFLIAVNGKVITTKGERQLQGEINLRPGIHKIEIWATGWLSNIGFGRKMKLRANLIDPDVLMDCPETCFDPATFPPASLDHRNTAASAITASADSTEFTVKFAKESRARLIRLLMVESGGGIPALNKLALTGPDGKMILPVANDFAELNKNDTLEILTGDRISVRYVDDRFITKARERHERFLDVSFTDARAEFADMQPRFSSRHNEDMPYYEKLLRFPYDKPLDLAIHDADMDVTVAPDKVKVSLETPAGTKDFEAVETGDSTGVFKLTVTPVSGSAKNDAEIQVPEGGTMIARYIDQENNRPGVPTPRVATISHAAFVDPQIRLSHATVTAIVGDGAATSLQHGFERRNEERPDAASEFVRASWQIDHSLIPSTKAPEGGFQSVLGQSLYLEVFAPQMALGTASKIDVFAQTDEGRRAAGKTTEGFDKNVPGTLLLESYLDPRSGGGNAWHGVPLLPIYQTNPVPGFGENPGFDRFFLTVPLILGTLPEFGGMTFQERYDFAKAKRESLEDSQRIDIIPDGPVVRPGENVYIGFRYTAPDGSEKWATATTKVITHPAFDIMSEDFRTPVTSAYVGENLNLRVVDLGADASDAPDTVRVLMQSKSGAKHSVELHESGPHTGIFKAGYLLAYADAKSQPATAAEGAEPVPYDVRNNGFPVSYGDTVAARYTDANGVKSGIRQVTISKGADGTIAPFSKKYDDPQIAMRTQFSLAEAYLEVAKRHRKLNEHEAAALEYESAKQLLSKAMDQFTDPETRSHAEYLLGVLTMEEADTTGDAGLKETRYRAALSRFLNVTGSYSQTLHASKAQYQIAMIYERLQEPEIAAQEYVKLAYKYPDSEFLATSMARLGTHFLKKAGEYEQQAKPLLEKAKAEENKDAQYEGDALMKMAVAEYLKTAQIFSRLQERFPSDTLAGQAGLRAGQSYMRAGKNQEAVDAFQRVIAEQGYDGKTIRAQAMYWTGMCYQALKQPMAAYSIFKRLTYDFPESEWAAYARGQLSQEGLLDLENKLELERLESEQK